MSTPEIPLPNNEVFIVPPDELRAANRLIEEILEDFIDDRFDWPTITDDDSDEVNALQRMVTENGIAVVLTKGRIEAARPNQLQIIRYLLELQTRALMIIPEIQELDQPAIPDEQKQLADDALFELGFNTANQQDWDDFMVLLLDGKLYGQTVRSLEQKLGIPLGKAATAPRWDFESPAF